MQREPRAIASHLLRDIFLSLLISHLAAALWLIWASGSPLGALFIIPSMVMVTMAAAPIHQLFIALPVLTTALVLCAFWFIPSGWWRVGALSVAYAVWPLGFLVLFALN